MAIPNENDVRPIIQEIVRTEVCFPNIQLLVDYISVEVIDAEQGKETFRLYLTDGEVNIRALIRSRLHRAVIEQDVGRGSVLVLKEYSLARAKRLNGEGEVVYFAVRDFFAFGYRKLPDITLEDSPDPTQSSIDNPSGSNQNDLEDAAYQEAQGGPLGFTSAKSVELPANPVEVIAPGVPRDVKPRIPRSSEWVKRASIEHHRRCHEGSNIAFSARVPVTDDEEFRQFCDRNPLRQDVEPCLCTTDMALEAIMKGMPLKPFNDRPKIKSLAAVTGRNKSRNRDVDVLAMILSCDSSTTKPASLPLKRDIRIIDASVEEPIVLGIFIDPINTLPKAGTIALFRHVTTHDFRKGNLNAYPARVAGREWFIPNPVCFGLKNDIRRLADRFEGLVAKQDTVEHGSVGEKDQHAAQ